MAGAASLSLGRLLGKKGDGEGAHTVLKTTADKLFPLRRVVHLERMAVLDEEMGRAEEARQHSMEAHMLSRPFEDFPDKLCRKGVSCNSSSGTPSEVFPEFHDLEVKNSSGESYLLQSKSDHPRLLVFWTSGCAWVQRAAEDLGRSRQALADSFGLEILWLNMDREKESESGVRRASELGLDPRRLYLRSGTDERSSAAREYGIDGSPWSFLILGDGRIVLEISGYRSEGWAPRIASVLRQAAMHGNQKDRPKQVSR
jgi:thiol-disulfide isomerase/thioredoxin